MRRAGRVCLLGFAGKNRRKAGTCRRHARCRSPGGDFGTSSRQLGRDYSSRISGGRGPAMAGDRLRLESGSRDPARKLGCRRRPRALPCHLHEEERRAAHDRKGNHDHEVIEHRHSIKSVPGALPTNRTRHREQRRAVSGKRDHRAERCRSIGPDTVRAKTAKTAPTAMQAATNKPLRRRISWLPGQRETEVGWRLWPPKVP